MISRQQQMLSLFNNESKPKEHCRTLPIIYFLIYDNIFNHDVKCNILVGTLPSAQQHVEEPQEPWGPTPDGPESFLYEKPLNRTYIKNSSKIVFYIFVDIYVKSYQKSIGDVDFTEKLIFFMIQSVFLKIFTLSPSIGKADDFINF